MNFSLELQLVWKKLKIKYEDLKNKIKVQNKVIKTLVDNIDKLQVKLDKLEDIISKF
jgi:hypothetical protein